MEFLYSYGIFVDVEIQEHIVRVRGFPARDILSLCALGDGIGQDNKIVGASSPSSASFSSVLGLVRKSYTK